MPARELRFLVVEDHEFQRRGVAQLLQGLGATAVHCAEDGRAALQIIRDPDRPVDIVVCDLAMPGMDGMEFIRHLGQSGAQVSLLVASALEAPVLSSVAHMARAYQTRLLGVVGKPLTAVKLKPLLELHRARAAGNSEPDTEFALDEIADAWTHGEFELWFEPRIDLASGACCALHATPRWRHPARGLLVPEDFLPSVRARGLGEDFAWLMLGRGLKQAREWQSTGKPLGLSLPLHFAALDDLQLAPRIRQLAANEGVAPGDLILGLRESLLDTRRPKVLENLTRLRVDGFGLAVDDFGDGDMAVEQLGLLPLTDLKIQDSFVTGADRDDNVRAGLAVGLELAQQLRLRTTAAGISSRAEWTLLHEWGCHHGQGPFIAPPMPARDVSAWLGRWSGAVIR